jgi:DNA helicase-2/ATP-dependent DNA helicase PcrA
MLLVLNYLCAEHDVPYSGDEMLFEILHFEWLGIPSIEIAKASHAGVGAELQRTKNIAAAMAMRRSSPAADRLV